SQHESGQAKPQPEHAEVPGHSLGDQVPAGVQASGDEDQGEGSKVHADQRTEERTKARYLRTTRFGWSSRLQSVVRLPLQALIVPAWPLLHVSSCFAARVEWPCGIEKPQESAQQGTSAVPQQRIRLWKRSTIPDSLPVSQRPRGWDQVVSECISIS